MFLTKSQMALLSFALTVASLFAPYLSGSGVSKGPLVALWINFGPVLFITIPLKDPMTSPFWWSLPDLEF